MNEVLHFAFRVGYLGDGRLFLSVFDDDAEITAVFHSLRAFGHQKLVHVLPARHYWTLEMGEHATDTVSHTKIGLLHDVDEV